MGCHGLYNRKTGCADASKCVRAARSRSHSAPGTSLAQVLRMPGAGVAHAWRIMAQFVAHAWRSCCAGPCSATLTRSRATARIPHANLMEFVPADMEEH